MKNLFKKSVAIFVTVLMFACMLFTSVACDKDDGNAQFVKCSRCNGSGKVYVFYNLYIILSLILLYHAPPCQQNFRRFLNFFQKYNKFLLKIAYFYLKK